MAELRDKIIDIILKVAMAHHDDISAQDEYKACEAADEIKSLFKSKLPNPIKPEMRIAQPLCEISFNKGRIVGHNSAITEIEKIVEEI